MNGSPDPELPVPEGETLFCNIQIPMAASPELENLSAKKYNLLPDK